MQYLLSLPDLIKEYQLKGMHLQITFHDPQKTTLFIFFLNNIKLPCY